MDREKLKLAREATDTLYAMACEYRSLYQQELQARMNLEETVQKLEEEKKQLMDSYDKKLKDIKEILYSIKDSEDKSHKKLWDKLKEIEVPCNKEEKKSKEDKKSKDKGKDKDKDEPGEVTKETGKKSVLEENGVKVTNVEEASEVKTAVQPPESTSNQNGEAGNAFDPDNN